MRLYLDIQGAKGLWRKVREHVRVACHLDDGVIEFDANPDGRWFVKYGPPVSRAGIYQLMAQGQLGHSEDIYELMRRVREHPDYAFGCLFTVEDLPGSRLPIDLHTHKIEDRLAECGNEFIHDTYGDPEED